ncbi:MAG TPA: type II/IV secretion system ATPase subunit [Thermoplasmata archaeon]|nr:type II/IV secretion system ATPase subunit [Thermoplasmata archaeon]
MAKGKDAPKSSGGGLLYSAAGFMQKLSPRPVRVRGVRGEFKVNVKGDYAEGSDYTIIPEIEDPAIKVELFYPVNPPFVYARILYDNKRNEYIYEPIEPQLSAKELALYELIKDTFQRTVGYELDKLGTTDKPAYIKECINQFTLTRKIPISDIQKEKVSYYVIRDFVGYGPVDPLMQDERVEDVSCDGTNVPFFIFHQQLESIKTSVVFNSDDELDSYVIALAQRCGKQISVAMPILDGTSPEGHRVQATYGHEVTTRGSSFTIRRFKARPFTPTDIIRGNTASPEMIAYMWLAVEHGDSMIVCGGTASGKTSTLNAASLFIPPAAKIVSMEDTREINLPHENWIPGATRSGFGDRGVDGKAAGEIDMFDLVRAALRQRPNYIIVGEVRGKETYTMFQAMATGHTTYSTMHADSVRSMVNRLENPPINCPRILLTALNFVIVQTHARVKDAQVRRIKQMVEIIGFEPETNELITNTVFEWDQASDKFIYKGHSFLFDKIQEIKNLTHDEMMEEFNRRVEIVNHFVAKDLTDFLDLAKIVVSYYKEPEETLAKIRQDKGRPGEE